MANAAFASKDGYAQTELVTKRVFALSRDFLNIVISLLYIAFDIDFLRIIRNYDSLVMVKAFDALAQDFCSQGPTGKRATNGNKNWQ